MKHVNTLLVMLAFSGLSMGAADAATYTITNSNA